MKDNKNKTVLSGSEKDIRKKMEGRGYKIPRWCRMLLADHADGLGGCWGISHGLTDNNYCASCEYMSEGEG